MTGNIIKIEGDREGKRDRDFVLLVMEAQNTPTTYEAALLKKVESESDQASCLN